MIKVENIETWGFEHAIRGMRNPMNSWDKSDSNFYRDVDCGSTAKSCEDCFECDSYKIGNNDLDLMKRLCKAGQPHRKYLRQIFVCMDITAPLYWWKEFDTYKVGTTTNSCSTMHKIHDKEFTLDDFSHEHLYTYSEEMLQDLIDLLNRCRNDYNINKRKDTWWQMIQLLPSSYNQRRTITMNYENVVNMIQYRTGHKLDEWREFVAILGKLPYLAEITKEDNEDGTNA